MNNFEKILNKLYSFKDFFGGDNSDVPINENAIINMEKLLYRIKEENIEIPETYPWYGGVGLQFEWEIEPTWYIEIDCEGDDFSYLLYKTDYNGGIDKEHLSMDEVLEILKKDIKNPPFDLF